MRCLARTDNSKIVRDVTYTRSKDGRPMDAFIRLQIGTRLIGTGYFRVEADKLTAVVDGAETGHIVQTVSIPVDFFSIVTHAVMLDGWAIGSSSCQTSFGNAPKKSCGLTTTSWWSVP